MYVYVSVTKVKTCNKGLNFLNLLDVIALLPYRHYQIGVCHNKTSDQTGKCFWLQTQLESII